MIRAEVHSDDRVAEAQFDATPWFEQASDEEIWSLYAIDWGFDYASDRVAEFMRDLNQEVGWVFSYIDARRKYEPMGFECVVNQHDAIDWLEHHHNHIYVKIVHDILNRFHGEYDVDPPGEYSA